MSLEPTLADITNRLRQGRFSNEQSISQGILLRVLQELGWDTWDTTIVWPEYQTGEGRVDFALCHPASRPAVFIEVKQPGMAEDGVRQALEYAFHVGVPFVVLTDGQTWSFYLPAERGSYEERRVYKLDLFERDARDGAATLEKYLLRKRVVSGEAFKAAQDEYRSQNRVAEARAAIPEAWRELVEAGDELLVELIADAVASKAGVRPEDDDVTAFLSRLGKPVVLQPPPTPAPRSRGTPGRTISVPAPDSQEDTDSTRSGTLILRGRAFHYANAKEAMVITLTELAKLDSTFLQRCSQHPKARGRRRRYIAKSPDELYPLRPDLRDLHESLPDGWFVATNLNNNLKRTIIRLAAEVAGLAFGTDVTVEF